MVKTNLHHRLGAYMLYILKGDPTPLNRPRFNSNSRKVWDSQKERKVVSSLDLKYQHGDRPLYEKALKIECIFYFRIPKTRKNKLKPGDIYYYKSDIDNLLKFIFDVGNKVLYTDDCLVAEVVAKKLYDDIPRTEMIITEIG